MVSGAFCLGYYVLGLFLDFRHKAAGSLFHQIFQFAIVLMYVYGSPICALCGTLSYMWMYGYKTYLWCMLDYMLIPINVFHK